MTINIFQVDSWEQESCWEAVLSKTEIFISKEAALSAASAAFSYLRDRRVSGERIDFGGASCYPLLQGETPSSPLVKGEALFYESLPLPEEEEDGEEEDEDEEDANLLDLEEEYNS